MASARAGLTAVSSRAPYPATWTGASLYLWKVLRAWFDAPIGYISNTRELLPESWDKWWKSADTKLVHFIGKDNIVFHCIVFPSMLKAYGDGYILPDNVPANEFLNLEGDKISTSRNWAV